MPTTDERTLYASKTKAVIYWLISAVFVSMGILMILDEAKGGWVITSFFGAGLLLFTVNMLPGACYLRLTKEGFWTSSLFIRKFIAWEDIESFGVASVQWGKTVGVNYKHPPNKLASLNRLLLGQQGILSNTYGLKAYELVSLMEEWRSRATAKPLA